MHEGWIERATAKLWELRGRCGWGYRQRSESAIEPTALASLALLSRGLDSRSMSILDESERWIDQLQHADGSVHAVGLPTWTTSLALWLWSARGASAVKSRRALTWLVSISGTCVDQGAETIFGHDTTIPGWPWVERTHSWVEPTVHALIALRCHGWAEHRRAREGVRLLLDRPVPSGGWNYGNTTVFGTGLRPQPDETGLALLALSGLVPGSHPAVASGIAFLREVLPTIRAPRSLGWGLIGLEAWNASPAASNDWLRESYEHVAIHAHGTCEIAALLLASCGALPRLLRLGTGMTSSREHDV